MDNEVFVIYSQAGLQTGNNEESQDNNTHYNLNQLIRMNNEFLSDKIFKTLIGQQINTTISQQFKYIKIKCH